MFIKLHEYDTGKPIIIMCNRISIIRTKSVWNFSECFTKIDEIAKPEYVTNIVFNDCYYPEKGSKRKIEIYVQETVDEIYKLLEYTTDIKKM